MSTPAETPSRRYPTRLKAGSPLPPPPPPPPVAQSARKKRKLSNADSVPSSPVPVPRSPVPSSLLPSSPHTPAVQSNGARLCSLPSAKSCERTDPVAAGCSVPELPPSSSSLKDVPSASLGDLFAVYSYLRCFSRLLFLSPFSLEKFVTSLCAKCGDSLMDSVHFSLLEAVKRHALSTESSSFFGDMNWDLLDLVTWPMYLRSFLRTQGYSSLRKYSLVKAGLGKGEYQKKVPVAEKLAILSFLCDHALQNEESRKEVSVRLMAAHLGLIEPAGQRAGDGDSDFNPDAEHENRVKEVPLLRKVSDKLLKDTEKGEWSKEVQRAATALGGDGNSNDCMICGMDGVLICCDACPAAYHSRCVGATKGKLGSGDWYCPECRLPCAGIPYAKRLLGAVVLGIGPQERLFLATCDHLLVSDVSEGEEKYWYYGVSELFTVLKYLQACGHGYHDLQTNIRRQWGNDLMSLLGRSSSEDLVSAKDTPVSSTPKLRCQSERKEKKRKADVSEDSELDTPAKKTPKSDSKSKTPKTPKMQPNPGPYVNNYIHGDAVATAADTLAAWQGGGDPAWEPGARVRGTSANEQVKAFTVSLPIFAWPSNRKLYSEKCGWCGLCSTNTRGCLLVQTHLQVSRQVDDLRPLKVSRGPRHLGTVTAYVLHLEETLHPLIEGGPWDFPLQRQKWRSRLEKNPSVSALRMALLQLEAYLRPITLSTDWVKHPDLAPMLFPACMVKRQSLPWTPYKGVPPIRYCGAQWWRGGKMARLLCDWESLPRESLIKAARIGGGKAIPGLLYNDSNAVPQRSKQCAWRARVEASSSIAEIGLQVRYLDVQLKWKELLAEPVENATPYIFGKSKEEAVTKYLVAMTSEEIGAEKLKQESQPSVNQSVPSISSEGVRQIWKPEQQVPLSKVKLYEKENLGERGKKGSSGKKKIGWNKTKTTGKRSLSSVMESLLASIISDEKKVELSAKKLQTYSKSPVKPATERKPEPVIIRRQCNRCSADGDKVELSTVDGMLVCGQCHGKRPRKLSAKALAALSNEEVGSDESSPTETENGKVLIKVDSPPLKLQWSGTSLRKSGRKRKRVNLNAGAFAWIDAHDLSDNGSMKMETRTKLAQR